jgi:ribosomal protein L37AE/L43A
VRWLKAANQAGSCGPASGPGQAGAKRAASAPVVFAAFHPASVSAPAKAHVLGVRAAGGAIGGQSAPPGLVGTANASTTTSDRGTYLILVLVLAGLTLIAASGVAARRRPVIVTYRGGPACPACRYDRCVVNMARGLYHCPRCGHQGSLRGARHRGRLRALFTRRRRPF